MSATIGQPWYDVYVHAVTQVDLVEYLKRLPTSGLITITGLMVDLPLGVDGKRRYYYVLDNEDDDLEVSDAIDYIRCNPGAMPSILRRQHGSRYTVSYEVPSPDNERHDDVHIYL